MAHIVFDKYITPAQRQAINLLASYGRTQIHHLTVERASVTLVVGWMGSQLAVSVLIRWSRKPEMGPKAVSRPISAVVGHSAASALG